jgi:hypothetical protein
MMPLVLFFVFGLAIFAMFDVLVRFEYANYRSDWERDGSPHGFFWVPEEAKGRLFPMFPSFRSRRAHTACARRWLFRTPPWIGADSSARKALVAYRILAACGLLTLAGMFFL